MTWMRRTRNASPRASRSPGLRPICPGACARCISATPTATSSVSERVWRTKSRLWPGFYFGQDLSDRAQVIGGVGRRRERRGCAHAIPARACGDHLSPLLCFVPELVAQGIPLLLADCPALPARVPVHAGPGIRLARGPAVERREANLQVIDVRGNGRLPGAGSARRRARIDTVELA